MDLMQNVWDELGDERANAGTMVTEMMENAREQRLKLDWEVQRWCQERGV
jgi:hypothetical protein